MQIPHQNMGRHQRRVCPGLLAFRNLSRSPQIHLFAVESDRQIAFACATNRHLHLHPAPLRHLVRLRRLLRESATNVTVEYMVQYREQLTTSLWDSLISRRLLSMSESIRTSPSSSSTLSNCPSNIRSAACMTSLYCLRAARA
jgi:hypothetical protein